MSGLCLAIIIINIIIKVLSLRQLRRGRIEHSVIVAVVVAPVAVHTSVLACLGSTGAWEPARPTLSWKDQFEEVAENRQTDSKTMRYEHYESGREQMRKRRAQTWKRAKQQKRDREEWKEER